MLCEKQFGFIKEKNTTTDAMVEFVTEAITAALDEKYLNLLSILGFAKGIWLPGSQNTFWKALQSWDSLEISRID